MIQGVGKMIDSTWSNLWMSQCVWRSVQWVRLKIQSAQKPIEIIQPSTFCGLTSNCLILSTAKGYMVQYCLRVFVFKGKNPSWSSSIFQTIQGWFRGGGVWKSGLCPKHTFFRRSLPKQGRGIWLTQHLWGSEEFSNGSDLKKMPFVVWILSEPSSKKYDFKSETHFQNKQLTVYL